MLDADLDAAVPVPVPAALARAVAALTWRARWTPAWTAVEALDDLLAGLRDAAGEATPPLAAGRDAPGRAHEVATGRGARTGL